MPIFLPFVAAATLAVVAPPTSSVAPIVAPYSIAASGQPTWRTIHADTVGDLLLTTETLNGRVRFSARGMKGSVPVVTSDFTPDSVRAWVGSATELVSSAAPKQGEMSGLGQALTINVTTATTGETVFGFYVGDATSDQQLALALKKPDALKLTAGVNSALDAVGH